MNNNDVTSITEISVASLTWKAKVTKKQQHWRHHTCDLIVALNEVTVSSHSRKEVLGREYNVTLWGLRNEWWQVFAMESSCSITTNH